MSKKVNPINVGNLGFENPENPTQYTCGECEEYCSFAKHKCLLNKCFVSSADGACDHFIKKEE